MVKLLNITDMIQSTQILIAWLHNQHIDSIIIISETLTKDPVQSFQFRLMMPNGMRVAIKELSGVNDLLQNVNINEQSIVVMTEQIEDAQFILKNMPFIEQVFL